MVARDLCVFAPHKDSPPYNLRCPNSNEKIFCSNLEAGGKSHRNANLVEFHRVAAKSGAIPPDAVGKSLRDACLTHAGMRHGLTSCRGSKIKLKFHVKRDKMPRGSFIPASSASFTWQDQELASYASI